MHLQLQYIVKLKICVSFCKNSNAGKVKLKKFYLLTEFTYLKRCNFLQHYGKFTQENMYQTISESASFCDRYDKNILMCFFSGHTELLFTRKTRMLSFTR